VVTSLEQLIGAEAASKLAKQYGGTRLYIPAGESVKGNEIKALIGETAYKRLVQEYSGSRIRVPTLRRSGPSGSKAAIAQRNQQVIEMAWASRSELAQRFKLSESQIYLILKQLTHGQTKTTRQQHSSTSNG
jgi:Mor family transcriptional regulator